MREFILFSRKGWTTGDFPSLREAGRLDTVYQCILTALFLSHRIRRHVRFHAVLNGPPEPPVHLTVDGGALHDVRVDPDTWGEILRRVLSGGQHPGVTADRNPFQAVVRDLAGAGARLFVLEERGRPLEVVELTDHNVFVVGDHVGLPRGEERFVLRFGEKVSIGRTRYLSASVIDIINHHLDQRGL